MSDCVIYCRISRDREGSGLKTERQEQDCRRLAEQLGLTVTRVYKDDDRSAYSGRRRPEYEEMMKAAEAGDIKVILAYSNSRLTRRSQEFGRLIRAHDQHGVRIHTVASGSDDLSTADGRMVAKIKADIDEAESHRISERTKRGQKQAREEGGWHGGWRPYGYQDDGITPNPDEVAVLRELTKKVIAGKSITSLISDLNSRGIMAATGKPWTGRTLRRTLLRPHPSVKGMDTVKLILTDDNRRTTPGPQRRWLLSGIALCHCGSPLRGSGSSLGKGRGTYPAYRCSTGKHTVVSAVTLDEYVAIQALAYMCQPENEDVLYPPAPDTEPLYEERTELKAQLKATADDLGVDVETLERGTGRKAERLREVQRQITAATITTPITEFKGKSVHQALKVWDDKDLEQRRMVIQALPMTITIIPGARGVIPRELRWRDDLPSFDKRRVIIDWA